MTFILGGGEDGGEVTGAKVARLATAVPTFVRVTPGDGTISSTVCGTKRDILDEVRTSLFVMTKTGILSQKQNFFLT